MPVCCNGSLYAEDNFQAEGMRKIRAAGLETGNITNPIVVFSGFSGVIHLLINRFLHFLLLGN